MNSRHTDTTPGEAGGTAGSTRFFARQATGLTREVSWVDALVYNLLWSSLPLSLALILAFGPAAYPDSNPYLVIVVALALTLPCAVLYAMLSSAVPRSGGDYTWVSRTVHPALGFMSNLSFCFWVTFFIGVYSVYLASYGIAPLLRTIAAYTSNPALLDAANWFVGRTGVIVVGVSLVILAALLLTFGRGLRAFMKFQKWAFVIWMVGAVLVPIIILLFTSKGTFDARLDTYAQNLGGPANATDQITRAAGPDPGAWGLGATVLMATLPYYTLGFIFQSAYFGGELKRGRRGALRSIVGAEIVAAALLLIGIAAFFGKLEPILRASGLAAGGEADLSGAGLSFPPFYTELAAIASGNLALALVPSVGMLLVFVTWIPQSMLLLSRSLFAWSFDRLLPDKISEVHPRTRSPVYAVAVITVLSVVSVIVVGMNADLTFVVGLFGLTLTYLLVCLAGVLFPYRQRETFESAPFNGRLRGVPVMSLVAGLGVLGMAVMAAVLLLDENSGTSLAHNPARVALGICVLAAGLPIYYLIRAVRRARGVDIDLAYGEIPPD